jgi:hypothetical protein
MKVDVNPHGGLAIAPNFFVPFQGERPTRSGLRVEILPPTRSVIRDRLALKSQANQKAVQEL